MHKKRVLQVIAGMDVGGAETFLMNIFKNIDKSKYEFYLLCYGNKKYDYEDDVKKVGGTIIRIDKPSERGYINHIKQIKKVIKDNKIDIVHIHTLFNSCFAVIAARMCKVKKIIVHSHNTMNKKESNIKDKIYYILSKFIINIGATDFLACGEEAGKFLFYKFNKFTVVNNGIEIDRFLYNKNLGNNLRKEYNIPENEKVVMHVGRFFEPKNHDFLIDIFQEVYKLDQNTKLMLIGKGDLEEQIKDKVKKLGLEEKVMFLGLKKNVNEIYNMADVFVFPSLYEGAPVVLYETQTNSLPAVISNNIDSSIQVNEYIRFKDLNDGAKSWAKEIIKLSRDSIKSNTNIYETKLNVKKSVDTIEKIYLK